jgi:hypothetical protein
LLDRAVHRFEDADGESGVTTVPHLADTVAAQRGDYAKAVENYESSLRIRERAGDKPHEELAVEFRRDRRTAPTASPRTRFTSALTLRMEIGDRWAIGISTNNLGMNAALRNQHTRGARVVRESMLLNREIGDARLERALALRAQVSRSERTTAQVLIHLVRHTLNG